jgi:hypothetical protein
MASEEIDQQFVVLIFYLAVHAVTLSLVEVDFRTPAMPLQSVPQAACHLDRPGLVSSAMTEKKWTIEPFDFDRGCW